MTRTAAPPATGAGGELDLVLRALHVPNLRRRLLEVTQAGAAADCRVLDAKYSPGRACTVLYAVGGRLVSGEVQLDRAGTRGSVPVQLSAFPEDRGLPSLRGLVDPVEARSLLAELGTDSEERVLTCSTSLLRYRAGRRATVRLSGRLRHRSGSYRQVVFVVKLYHDLDKAGAVAAEGTRLSRSRPVQDGTVGVAPLVAFLPALPAIAWAQVDGVPLDLLLTGGPGTPRAREAVRRAGSSLAGLHAAPGVSERRRSAEDELGTYAGRTDRAAAVCPDLGARMGTVLDGLAARRQVLEGAPERLLHGDCKPSQFLVSDQQVTVLDLDSCRRGDPAYDLGTFLATLRQRDLRTPQRSPSPAQGLAEAFLAGYCRAAEVAEREAQHLQVRAQWFEALALQRKALRAFARAPRSPLPAALVTAAEVVLARLDGRGT